MRHPGRTPLAAEILGKNSIHALSGASAKLLRHLARRRPRSGARCGAAVYGPRRRDACARSILAPGTRTVASLLRISGLMRERHFVNYHRVLNRAAWSPLLASRLLLRLLIETFAPNGPVVLGLDDTIERRRGKRIAAKGIYRDPV